MRIIKVVPQKLAAVKKPVYNSSEDAEKALEDMGKEDKDK